MEIAPFIKNIGKREYDIINQQLQGLLAQQIPYLARESVVKLFEFEQLPDRGIIRM